MELKRGYKQTEVGVIPVDWEVPRLQELVSSGPKNGFSGRSNDDARGTPTLSLAATTSGRLILNDTTVKYLDHLVPSNSTLYLEPGDVLVQRSNTADLVGTTAIFDGPPRAFIYPDLMMRLRFKHRITARLFWRFANSSRGRQFFRTAAAGSTGSMPKISGESLRQMPVPIPSLEEQNVLTQALDDTDALIESLEQLIAKKRQAKQGALQELLTGKKRLLGFEVKPGYKQSDVGVIPEDWEVKSVGTMGEVRAGKALAARGPGQKRFYLRTKNVFDGRIDLDDVLQMPMTDADFSRYRLRYGDILLNEGQSLELVGRCAMYKDEHPEPCAIQNQLIRFRARDGVSADFCAQLFRHCQKIGKFSKIESQTTSVAHLGVSRFHQLQLTWPRETVEQEAIATILSDMDAEVAALEAKLAKVQTLKQGMMQELLTGRIRLI